MNLRELRALCDLVMVNDPWPLSDLNQEIITDFLDSEASKLGYNGWIDALHFIDNDIYTETIDNGQFGMGA